LRQSVVMQAVITAIPSMGALPTALTSSLQQRQSLG
jgi:hypothetical protein